MILPDVNLLIYAIDEASPFHQQANAWWNDSLSSSTPVGLCYPSVLGFIRLVTSRRVFSNPLPLGDAVAILEEWIDQPNVTFVLPTARHWPILRTLLTASGTAGNLTTDAHIAALAIEHGYTVHSNDADFGRFQNLSWVNPLT
jgi:toxin-antitoxin system PIN domain toxin